MQTRIMRRWPRHFEAADRATSAVVKARRLSCMGLSPLQLGGVTDQCATPKPGAHADSAAKQSVEMRLV